MTFPKKETIDSKTLCEILWQKFTGSITNHDMSSIIQCQTCKIICLASTSDIFEKKESIHSKTLCGILQLKITGSMANHDTSSINQLHI